VIINLVYFTWWLFIRWQALHGQSLVSQDPKANGDAAISNRIPEPAAIITVTKAGKNILLPQTELTYVVLEGSYSFIKTLKGESFVTTYTLEELTKMLGSRFIFQGKQAVIVSRNVCKAYQILKTVRFSIDLSVDVKFPVL
jgi:DNA-binding LytR/AlgR family response regulator